MKEKQRIFGDAYIFRRRREVKKKGAETLEEAKKQA